MVKARQAKRKLKYPLRVILPVALIAVVVAFGTMRLIQMFDNRVSVENRSNLPLTAVNVKLGDAELQLGSLSASGLVEKPFQLQGDRRFTVRVTRSDGSVLKAQGAYTSGGYLGERVRFVVHQDRIEVVQPVK